MELFELPEATIVTLVNKPETGMGYQRGNLGSLGRPEQAGFFIASLYFVPEQSRDLADNPAAHDFSKLLLLKAPSPLPAERFGAQLRVTLSLSSGVNPATLSAQPAAALPPHAATTVATDVFYRVSAFRNDRRVSPDGSLAPGSYSTTQTDITVVPNGLAAVGRYAMPTRMSARCVFEIRPGAGVSILFGTVTPNYGLAGGGVEVFFPNGTGPNTVNFLRALPEK